MPFRFYVFAIAVAVLNFVVWNSVMLGLTNVPIPDLWDAIQFNAIHWCLFFCTVVFCLRGLNLLVPLGNRTRMENPFHNKLSIGDLLYATCFAAILFASVAFAFRSLQRPLALNAIVTAIRGGATCAILFAAIVVAGQARKNRILWIVLLLLASTAIRFATPWLNTQMVRALLGFEKDGIFAYSLIQPYARQPLFGCFVESIVQIALWLIMIDVFRQSRLTVYSPDSAERGSADVTITQELRNEA